MQFAHDTMIILTGVTYDLSALLQKLPRSFRLEVGFLDLVIDRRVAVVEASVGLPVAATAAGAAVQATLVFVYLQQRQQRPGINHVYVVVTAFDRIENEANIVVEMNRKSDNSQLERQVDYCYT